MEWIVENWLEILASLESIVIVAAVIVKATDTKRDDNFWHKYVVPVLNVLAINPSVENKKV